MADAGVVETLDFIAREELGPYDVFTLQVLPDTAVRQQAAQYGMCYQDRPPYYVLGSNQLDYADLRRLRRDRKRDAGLEPDMIEGMPEPRREALCGLDERRMMNDGRRTTDDGCLSCHRVIMSPCHHVIVSSRQLASHVDIIAPSSSVLRLSSTWLAQAVVTNPATVCDLYLLADEPPAPDELRAWRDALPYQPGYLDRVAVHSRAEPAQYQGVAEIIWRFTLAEGEAAPFRAWEAAGGAGVALSFGEGCTEGYRAQALADVQAWEQETGRMVWRTWQGDTVRG